MASAHVVNIRSPPFADDDLRRRLARRASSLDELGTLVEQEGAAEAMRDLLRRLGPVTVVRRDGPTVELETELPRTGLHPGLKELLRQSPDVSSPMKPAGTLVPAGGPP